MPYQSVEFHAYASSYPCSVTDYSWDFGDGSGTSGPSAYNVEHAFQTEGSKQVTTTVTDNCGNTTKVTLTHQVVHDDPPVAAFTTTVKSTNPLAIYADPSDSTDSDPSPLYYYSWNWGDGKYSSTYADNSNGGVASHAYATAGTYTVTLEAYDTEWNYDSVSHPVTVGRSKHAQYLWALPSPRMTARTRPR